MHGVERRPIHGSLQDPMNGSPVVPMYGFFSDDDKGFTPSSFPKLLS